jgi:alginate O-acetyltransferase complex protein AlgJ
MEEPEGAIAPLRGRDGWLFLTGDSNDVLGQHTGAIVPDRRWERRWSRLLRGRIRLARRLGATYGHVIVPDKEAVYADLLPPEIVPAPRRPIHRLLELAQRAGIEILYPLAALQDERSWGPIFHPTDTHWTGRGGYIGYRATCDALAARGVELRVVGEDEIEWVEDTKSGDLGSRLQPPPIGTGFRARLREHRARLIDDNRISVTGRRLETERADGEGPTCVIFGTSYAVYTLLFFAESFRRLVFVHTTAVDCETVREERPDVLLAITSERGIRRPPDDRRAHELLAATVERKRREGQTFDPVEGRPQGLPSLLPPP